VGENDMNIDLVSSSLKITKNKRLYNNVFEIKINGNEKNPLLKVDITPLTLFSNN
jgi:hypothetical protein